MVGLLCRPLLNVVPPRRGSVSMRCRTLVGRRTLLVAAALRTGWAYVAGEGYGEFPYNLALGSVERIFIDYLLS